jgi:hypothetical protein
LSKPFQSCGFSVFYGLSPRKQKPSGIVKRDFAGVWGTTKPGKIMFTINQSNNLQLIPMVVFKIFCTVPVNQSVNLEIIPIAVL